MKKIFLLTLPFLLSCQNNITSSLVGSNSDSSSSINSSVSSKVDFNDQEIREFVATINDMNDVVSQKQIILNTDNNLKTTSNYTSTLYNNNIIIDNGESKYEDSTFSFEKQVYETKSSVIEIWYYGPNSKDNYSISTPKSRYTEESLKKVFSLNENDYFYSLLNSIINDEEYERTEDNIVVSHIFNRSVSLSLYEGVYTLICSYDSQITQTEDGSSASEVMSYDFELSFSNNRLINSYEKIEGAQFLGDYQYNYAMKETTMSYHYTALSDFKGTLYSPESI